MPSAGSTLSVVVPVYNGEGFLAGCVENLRRQTRPPDEVIVVDDGSTDGTAAVARRLVGDVRYLRQANDGPGAARNRGLELARGSVVGLLDVDDVWPVDRSELLLFHLAREPALDAVLGRVQHVRGPVAGSGEPAFVPLGAPVHALLLGSGLYRRAMFDRIGPFAEELRIGDDTDWFLRAMEQSAPMRGIEATTLLYRMHAGNITGDRSAWERGMLAALRRSLDRRLRAGGGEAAPLAPIPGTTPVDPKMRRAIEQDRTAWRGRQAGPREES